MPSKGYVVVQTKNEQMQMTCEPNGTKCKDVGTGTVFTFTDTLRCVPAMGTKPTVHKWIECDALELHDSEGQKVKRRRRCKGNGHESSGCQYDITCSSGLKDQVTGFILNVDGMKAVRMSIVCDSNGKWKEKHSKLVITQLNKLNCTPALHRNNETTQPSAINATRKLPEYNVRKQCTPIIPHSDDNKKLHVAGECHFRFSVGCQYNITCYKGLVININELKADRMSVVCSRDGRWREKHSNLLINDVNALDCIKLNVVEKGSCERAFIRSDERKSVMRTSQCNSWDLRGCQYRVNCRHGLVLNIFEKETPSAVIICASNGKWLEKTLKLPIKDINNVDCVSRLVLNIFEKETPSAVIICASDGKWLEKTLKFPIKDINSVDCVSRKL
uniref:Sushi domain-containing protein n=1 Tax=Ascaris lumbricoides TaxID=6252 RepID=A0A0M3IRH8_ASCLU